MPGRRAWAIGDRAVFPHRHRGKTIRTRGTITEIDSMPGRPGVLLVFDEPDPTSGATQCYATHRELERER